MIHKKINLNTDPEPAIMIEGVKGEVVIKYHITACTALLGTVEDQI